LILWSFPASVLHQLLNNLLVISPEAVIFFDVLWLVFLEVEKGSGILLIGVIRITEIVEKISISLFDVFDQLFTVLTLIRIELASCWLEFIGLGGLSS
jgi:hypothetical protein